MSPYTATPIAFLPTVCAIGTIAPAPSSRVCTPCSLLLTTTTNGSVVCDSCRYSSGTPTENTCYRKQLASCSTWLVSFVL